MSDLSKHQTAFELFGSIIVFQNENKLCYAGDVILKFLATNGIDIEKIVTNNYTGEDGQSLLNAINKVRQHNRSYVFRFKKSIQDLLLFPSNWNGNNEYVCLSLKDSIEHINSIEHNLKERVKELQCLYNISHELHLSRKITEAFGKCTEHIKQGFQYPDICTVVIEYNKIKYISKGGSENKIKNLLSDENILKNKERNGEIRVIYHKKLPFLKEEINLIKEISQKFSRAIDKEERTQVLEKQKRVLLSRNRTLSILTKRYRENKDKLQTFFRAITDKITVIDSEFNIILSNRDDIGNTGKCYNKIFDFDHVCKDCPAIITFKTHQSASLEKEYSNKFYNLLSYPIIDDLGNVDSVLEVCRDVTKEKKMESQLIESYKFASLGKLVAGVAHEINNPNTFILGNTKIIKEAFNDIMPIIDEKYLQDPNLKIARLSYELFKENITLLIDDIYSGAVKIKKIVEDLRNFAKKDDDTLSDSCDINNIIEYTIRLVKKQIKDNVKVNLLLRPDIPIFVGNTSKLEQVIINLVINASQAIGNEGGEISIRTDFDSSYKRVVIVVRDNGKGMDEATKKNIFDPFFTTKRNEGGIGLGLSISYRIIKEHKGNIEVSSQLGNGTTFTIYLPVNEIE